MIEIEKFESGHYEQGYGYTILQGERSAKGCSALPALCRTIGTKAFSPTYRLQERYFTDCLTSTDCYKTTIGDKVFTRGISSSFSLSFSL